MIESQISPFQNNRRRSQRVVARIRIRGLRREDPDSMLSEDTPDGFSDGTYLSVMLLKLLNDVYLVRVRACSR